MSSGTEPAENMEADIETGVGRGGGIGVEASVLNTGSSICGGHHAGTENPC
ncbi:hypothetical protein PF011_g29097 [Phytophthora fragariae]|uniref:Uncharacterized protein n=1 Tax=Phytophthora fragariae TaxID=53985 RepID=A0A6A3H377_9STRA|nr:hypothetical protein PF003_g39413 [Phytophthora fragariae]KAE8963268.1 hypothetical protein PF011_g29097 [Phytophthora fragariae]